MESRLGSRRLSSSCASVFCSLLLGGPVLADSLPGEVLKFQQLPLTGESASFPYPGHDETSTAYTTSDPDTGQPAGWKGNFMADDFADASAASIVHVGWWGSYAENFTGTGGVRNFLISFESDVPGGGSSGGSSHPGTPLLSQAVTKGPLAPFSGTFTEQLVLGTSGTESLYHYNAELNFGKSFVQQPNTVYWLKIVALVDANLDGAISWGWHDRNWLASDPLASAPPALTPGEGVIGSLGSGLDVHHFQDDAVAGSVLVGLDLAVQQSGFTPQVYVNLDDGPTGIAQFSKDLAFELYMPMVPEPGTGSLVAVGVVALGVASRRRRLADGYRCSSGRR